MYRYRRVLFCLYCGVVVYAAYVYTDNLARLIEHLAGRT